MKYSFSVRDYLIRKIVNLDMYISDRGTAGDNQLYMKFRANLYNILIGIYPTRIKPMILENVLI